MSMGMSLNLSLLLGNPILSFGIVSLLIFIKAVVLCPIAYLFGLKGKNSFAVALVLAQSGEFALVLFSLANHSNLMTDELFQQLLLVVLLSMLVTPVLAHLAHRLIKTQDTRKIISTEKPVTAPIVLAGFGRIGHRIGEILSTANKPFVALDSDALIVKKERANGHPVFYGDVRNPELLKAAGASNAQIIIVTLNDSDATEQVVSSLRKTHPETNIYVRGHSLSQCRELRRLGASGAVSEHVEASLELARMVLINVGVNKKERDAILENFRRTYHAQIDDLIRSEKTNSQI